MAFAAQPAFSGGGFLCPFTNGKYTGVSPTREITVDVNTTGMTYTHTSGTGFGACTGAGATLQHDGKYEGKDLVTCETEVTNIHVGCWIE
jgi:hypothetical protein